MRKVVFFVTMSIVVIFAIFLLFNRKIAPVYLQDIISDRQIEYEDINKVEIFDINDSVIEGRESWMNAVAGVVLITPLTKVSSHTGLPGNYYKVFLYTYDYSIGIQIYNGYFKYGEETYKTDDIAYETIIEMIEMNK